MKTHQFWKDAEYVHTLLPQDEQPFTPAELAGFYDGDGSFWMPDAEDKTWQVGATATQCHYGTLRLIQKRFGGIMSKRDTSDRSENQRFQYALMMRNIEVTLLIPTVLDHLVLKAGRAARVLKSLDYYNATDEESKQARLDLAAVDHTRDPIHFDRISKDYIRGLFCAEGCLRLDRLSICQKSCLELLRAIKDFVDTELGANIGKVNDNSWIMHKQAEIKAVLDWMTDNNTRRLFHEEKAQQIDLFYEYMETRDQTLKPRISELKHIDYDIPGNELKATNKDGKAFTAKLRSVAAGREIAPNQPRADAMTDAQRETVRELLKKPEKEMSLAMIAEHVGCTKPQVSYLKKTENITRPDATVSAKQLTRVQREKALELLKNDDDISLATIAERVGCTKGQIWRFKESIAKGAVPARGPGRKKKATGTELVVKQIDRSARKPVSPKLTLDQKRKVQELLGDEKLTLDEIAAGPKCTKAQVCHLKKGLKQSKKLQV